MLSSQKLMSPSSSEKLHAPSTCWIRYLGDFCLSIKILREGTFCTSSLPFMIEQLSCRMLTWTSECPGDGGEECWEEWQGWVVCLLLVLLLSSASLRTDTGDPWVIKGGISRSRSVKEALGEVLVAYFFFKKLLRRLESRLLCEGDFFFLFTWFWAGMGLISDESSEMEKSPYVSLKEKARPLWLSVLQNSKHSLPMVGKSPSQGAIVRVLSWVKECLVRDLRNPCWGPH